MKQGYLIVASGKDYVKQACLCAMSIKHTQTIKNISIVTNDTVPKKYQPLFFKDFTIDDITRRNAIHSKKPGSKAKEVVIYN